MASIATWTTNFSGVTEDMKRAMASREWAWLQTAEGLAPNHTVPTATASWDACHALAAELRAMNPQIKIGIYGWGALNVQGYSPVYADITTDMLLHRLDGGPFYAPFPADNPWAKMVDAGNATWRSTLVNLWAAWLSDPAHPYDGLILDSVYPDGLAQQAQIMSSNGGCREGDAFNWAWWASTLDGFTEQLRWALESRGKILLTNGISIQPFEAGTARYAVLGPHNLNLADSASGVLAEHVHRAYRDADQFASILIMLLLALQKHRRVYMCAQPGLFASTDPGFAWAPGPEIEGFFLAMYKLIEDPPCTMFSYHDGAPYVGVKDGQPYTWTSPLTDHLDDLGPALGPVVVDNPSGAAWRPFYGGLAVVNPSDTFKPIPLGRSVRVWHPTEGAIVTVDPGVPGTHYFNAGPKSGYLLFYA